jgi:hypothetical protein
MMPLAQISKETNNRSQYRLTSLLTMVALLLVF